MLSNEGYTVRGVQKLLKEQPKAEEPVTEAHEPAMFASSDSEAGSVDVERLIELRDRLRNALTD